MSDNIIPFPENEFERVLKEKLENLYEPQAQSKSISYDVTLANDHRGFEFPKSKLLQILGNLISNAVKFTPENRFVQVELNIKKTDKTLSAIVKDNGVGISPEQIEKLLNDEGESTQGTGNEKGYGFGLKLAKHLADSLNGTLQIESERNKGTTITVSIPF
ncbi:MAG: ATP-binding protein [Gracilimonas sp.]|uniref:sensor histidine kinase n=1 Tax=Gracilimonas sp. TaxID=1974203 RepID=UPI0019B60602|nr:ATP-binding protein [Gracilimonas sp.]MBD3616110.1 ATP-binding protein [Gracilimonas sp.]